MNNHDMMGQRVRVWMILDRTRIYRPNKPRWRVYLSKSIEARDGWVVGFRTVYEGASELYIDEGWTFHPTRHLEVMLVAFHPRQRPVCVAPDVGWAVIHES